MLTSIACARFQTLLNRFQLGEAESLKLEMNAVNCIISGSAALYMFYPDAFNPVDVDFYVSESGADEFEGALRQRGFKEKDGQPKCTIYGKNSALRVGRLYKAGVARTVNLIITREENPLSAVIQFHSTIVMNAITADGIISLYPLTTLAGQGIITTNTASTQRCFLKYMFRGFSLTTQFPPHTCLTTAYCRKKMRSIEDDDVLVIPFTSRGSKEATLSNFAPFSWCIGRVTQGRNTFPRLPDTDMCSIHQAPVVTLQVEGVEPA